MNQFFAPLILKEKLYRIDIIASAIVFAGCTLTTVTGNHEDQDYTLDDLLDQYKQPGFIFALTVLLGVMTAMLVSIMLSELKSEEDAEAVKRAETINTEAEVDAISEEAQSGLSRRKTPGSSKNSFGFGERQSSEQVDSSFKTKLVGCNQRGQPFFYAFVAGGFGAMQNIFFKSLAVLLSSSAFNTQTLNEDTESPWKTFYPYVFMVFCLLFALSQLSFLNKGMSRYDAVMVFPLYNACYLTLSVLMGAIYYGEFDSYTTLQWVLFPIGILITVIGVVFFVFSPRKPDENHDHKNKESAENEEQVTDMEIIEEGIELTMNEDTSDSVPPDGLAEGEGFRVLIPT